MRVVLQRVSSAAVTVAGDVVGSIDRGLLLLVGVSVQDTESDVDWMVAKVGDLRVFPPEGESDGMEHSVLDVGGEILAVSQFTLMGDCRKGRRPSWSGAARPEVAERLYERFVFGLRARGIVVATGRFRTEMQVGLVNDGPVTLVLDSRSVS